MVGPLLYQPRQSWRAGVAFGAAALIHFAAVALASIHQREQIEEIPSLPPGVPEVEIEPASPIDDSTPPPDMDTPSPMPNPADEWLKRKDQHRLRFGEKTTDLSRPWLRQEMDLRPH